MVTMIRTQECFPRDVMFGDLKLMDAPQPKHSACPKGHTIPGLIGGWMCPCECHQTKMQDPLDELKKYINDRLQEMWQEYFDHYNPFESEEPVVVENQGTLERLIEKLDEQEVTDGMRNVIGKIVKTTKDDKGINAVFELNEKGSLLFEGINKDYETHLEDLKTRINYRPELPFEKRPPYA